MTPDQEQSYPNTAMRPLQLLTPAGVTCHITGQGAATVPQGGNGLIFFLNPSEDIKPHGGNGSRFFSILSDDLKPHGGKG